MIEFQDLSVTFKQKTNTFAAVKDVSFQIEKGEIFGIAGSSGAGKSTLLRTINLLQSVSSGNILVDGQQVTNYKGKELRTLRRKIGMIFQHFYLADNLTVYQNVAFALRAAGKEKDEVRKTVLKYLSLVGIPEKADVYPSKLSGGQKQRVAIARALANDAQILLCDEPTSALDVETTSSILELIRSLNQSLDITVVIITHELEVIKSICNRCAVMNQGGIAEIGDVYELFTNPKNEFTRQLIGHSQKFELPPDVRMQIKGIVVKLIFHGKSANLPVISYATECFGVHFNILLGRIEYIGERPLGVLYVNPIGEDTAIQQALSYLKSQVKELEVVYRAGV